MRSVAGGVYNTHKYDMPRMFTKCVSLAVGLSGLGSAKTALGAPWPADVRIMPRTSMLNLATSPHDRSTSARGEGARVPRPHRS